MGAMGLGDFLQFHSEFLRPTLLASEFRQRFGDELTDVLLREGVLEVGPLAKRYPCGQGKDRLYCSREVVEDPRDSGAFLALCRYIPSRCAAIALRADELVEYTASASGLGRVVRARMGLTGPFAATRAFDSDTVELGSFGAGCERREVFLALGDSIGRLLLERRSAHCHTVVLTPSTDGLPLEWRDRHTPGEHVVLGSLVDMLDCRGGEIVLLHPPRALTLRNAQEPSYLLVDDTGDRLISELEYEDVVRRAPNFGLFIDGTRPRADGTYCASRRAPDGSPVSIRLPRRDAMALIELVIRKGPVEPKQLPSLSDVASNTALYAFRAARRLVDDRLPKSVEWRWFHSVRSGRRGQIRLAFRPEVGVPFAVVAPLDMRP